MWQVTHTPELCVSSKGAGIQGLLTHRRGLEASSLPIFSQSPTVNLPLLSSF